jgi:hypothetical protein
MHISRNNQAFYYTTNRRGEFSSSVLINPGIRAVFMTTEENQKSIDHIKAKGKIRRKFGLEFHPEIQA